MASLKTLVLYGGNLITPNPYKVALLLEELGLPYETKDIPRDQIKGPEFTAVNPNGRLPALHDPNTDITLWESGAIMQYLISKYDKEHKVSFPADSNESHLVSQWLHFQMSGQGPYYGQAMWFLRFHPEKLPSAVERYQNEARRVTGVLDKSLEGKKYLVGNKCTYADLAFIPWQDLVYKICPEFDLQKEAPNVAAWMERMRSRPAIAGLVDKRDGELKSF